MYFENLESLIPVSCDDTHWSTWSRTAKDECYPDKPDCVTLDHPEGADSSDTDESPVKSMDTFKERSDSKSDLKNSIEE